MGGHVQLIFTLKPNLTDNPVFRTPSKMIGKLVYILGIKSETDMFWFV